MRILVAEDDTRLREHLAAALRGIGHEVDETGDGLDALARLIDRQPTTRRCSTSRCRERTASA